MKANNNSSITHADPMLYHKLRRIVNNYTQSINHWLQEEQGGNNSRLVNSLTKIIKESLHQEKLFCSATAFNLSITHKGGDLPSTLFYSTHYPCCQEATKILTFHCFILKKLIKQERISLLPSVTRKPYYPRYDQWLISAVEKVNENEQGDLEFSIDFDISTPKFPEAANSPGQFAKDCPICRELFLFKELAYKSIRDSRIRRVSKFPARKIKQLSGSKNI